MASAGQASERQIYDYFGNKDRLFDVVLESDSVAINEATLPITSMNLAARPTGFKCELLGREPIGHIIRRPSRENVVN
jgi:hypothetical protein